MAMAGTATVGHLQISQGFASRIFTFPDSRLLSPSFPAPCPYPTLTYLYLLLLEPRIHSSSQPRPLWLHKYKTLVLTPIAIFTLGATPSQRALAHLWPDPRHWPSLLPMHLVQIPQPQKCMPASQAFPGVSGSGFGSAPATGLHHFTHRHMGR